MKVSSSPARDCDRALLRACWHAVPHVPGNVYARVLAATTLYCTNQGRQPFTERDVVELTMFAGQIADELMAAGLIDRAAWQLETRREALRVVAERLGADPDRVAAHLETLERLAPGLEERLAGSLDAYARGAFPSDDDVAMVAGALAAIDDESPASVPPQ